MLSDTHIGLANMAIHNIRFAARLVGRCCNEQ